MEKNKNDNLIEPLEEGIDIKEKNKQKKLKYKKNQKVSIILIISAIIFIGVGIKILFLNKIKKMRIQSVEKGGELTSVIYNGKERLHDAKSFWNRHAPTLFPIVGKLKDGRMEYKGKEYKMGGHGFARDYEHKKLSENSYVLKSNEETLKKYPFDFEFYTTHTAEGNKVTTTFKVVNPSKTETMLFGIGGHPAYACDYSTEKYTLEFEKEEDDLEILEVIPETGLLKVKRPDVNKFIKNKKVFPLTKHVFDNDAVVFTNFKSTYVVIKENGKDYLKFNLPNFKYLGIWSKKGESPFVCIEPWMNHADYENSDGLFEHKEDIVKLEPLKEFTCSYSVEFY